MIKAIIFDCFGVLTADKWKEFVATLPEDQRQPAGDINHAYDAGFISEKEFITQIKKLTGRSPGEVENLTISEIGKNKELLNYINSLKQDYKIGLVSNVTSNWIRDYFLSKDEQALFDDMVMSFEVGTTKPDPKIYQIALNNLGVKGNEAIFIDDIERYAQAGREVGMQAIVYKDFEQMKSDLAALITS